MGFSVDSQPDDVTCGPVCLHGVYRYYGDAASLESVMTDLKMLEAGGTLDVFLANHALRRGYKATLYTYNLQLFDPSWFELSNENLRARLEAQAAAKRGRERLQIATRGYVEFLRLGGKVRLRDLQPTLLRELLNKGAPVITGLSATFLYRSVREVPETNKDDDVRGEPVGHFVVLTGYRRMTREILIADPMRDNPLVGSRYYAVKMHRLIGAILLGTMTYDANLLLIEPNAKQ